MKTDQIKILVITAAVLTLGAVTFNAGWTSALPANGDDVAAVYKTKCAACHSPKAEKFFDPAKTDEQHIEIILKGKKAEKPPNMLAFEKTMTPEQAKALAAYMRQLRSPAVSNTNVNSNVNANTNVNVNVNTNVNVNVNTNVNTITNANTNVNATANVQANTVVNINASANRNANTSVNTNVNTIVNTNTNTNANVTANANTVANSNAVANTVAKPKISDEIAQLYKTKCAACHSPKAEKFFDPAVADEQLVEIILKGKKSAKPLAMPGFEAKGVTGAQAKELVRYMRTLRPSGK
jgi:mono/diheme cytochrome c family protein